MSNTRVSDALARPARTGIQAAPAAVVTEFIDAFFYDMVDKQYAALLLFLTLVFGFIQTLWENNRGRAFWLRKVPPVDVPAGGE